MQQFLRAYIEVLCTRATCVSWAVSSLAMTVTGPFGTYSGLSVAERAGYWSGLIAIALVIGFAARTSARIGFGIPDGWRQTLVTAAIFTLAFTPVLYAITLAIAAPEARGDVFPPLKMASIVFSVPIVFHAARWFIRAPAENTEGSQDTSVGDTLEGTEPRLARRYSEDLEGAIMYVSVRDHYVDVVTDQGRTSLLMRFRDAMAELEGVAGAQVHRSHWVAHAAVDRVLKEGGRYFLLLKCGTRIPVSRGFHDRLDFFEA